MKKILMLLVILGCGMVILAMSFFKSNSSVNLSQVPDHSRVMIQLGDQKLEVEVVNTPDSVRQGLSGRSEIGADGMLFVFPEPHTASFWMKEMQFELDMVWFKSQTVVGVTAQVPAPDPMTTLADLPLYHSPEPIDMVLELPAGKAQELGIARGTQLKINR